MTWQSLVVYPDPAPPPAAPAPPATAKDPTIDALIKGFAADPTYQSLINTPVGYSAVDLPRLGGTVDNMMGTFVDDAIYNYLNTDCGPEERHRRLLQQRRRHPHRLVLTADGVRSAHGCVRRHPMRRRC